MPNDITLQIKEGEKVFSNNDHILKKQYFSFFKSSTIPLYKNLVSKKYTIFTGIPFGTRYDKLCNEKLLKNESKKIKTHTDINKCYNVYKDQDGNFIVEYITKNKGLLYILAYTKDSLVLNNKLSKNAFDKRLIFSK